MALAFAPSTVSLNSHDFLLEEHFHKRNYRHLVVIEGSFDCATEGDGQSSPRSRICSAADRQSGMFKACGID